jgi:hypothetical protein
MSVVGGAIIGLTIGALQTRYGFIPNVSILRFTTMGALAGFGGSMVSQACSSSKQCGLELIVVVQTDRLDPRSHSATDPVRYGQGQDLT